MLRVRVLGDLALELDGEPLEPPPSRRACELLGWLALNPGAHPRSDLAARFWPDVLDSSARASLRTALHELRRALGPAEASVVATRERVGLADEGVWVDARAVRELAAAGRGEEALALATGEPLAGLDEDWVHAARDEHRELVVATLEALAHGAEAGGDSSAAVRWTREQARLEPLSEEVARRLMRRLADGGDRPAALAAYARLEERLRGQLAVAPSAPTRELARALRAGPSPSDGAATPPPAAGLPLPPPLRRRERSAFVGRDDHLARLVGLVPQAGAGEPRIVLVAGEPGIGKTRLLAEACRAAHERGAWVLYGRCDEEPLAPYQPFVEALGRLVRAGVAPLDLGSGRAELARLVPELGGPDEPSTTARAEDGGARYRLFEAVAALLAAAAERAPTVLVLDDLHWAEEPTLLLLRHLARAPASGGLVVLGAYRSDELTPRHPLAGALADLRRDGHAERIRLGGLDRGAIVDLVAGWMGPEAPPGLPGALHDETEGNPFFVEEVLRHLLEVGALERRDGRWTSDRPVSRMGLPEGVREVIDRRLARLGDDAGRLLGAAAVMGRSFRLDLLEDLGLVPPHRALEALETAVAAGLAREEPGSVGGYAFSHALVRSAVEAGMSATRRARLHRAVADALERRFADALEPHLTELARHHLAAGPAGDAGKAVDFSVGAAARAMDQLAYEEAAGHLERALESLPEAGRDEPERRAELLADLGEARRRAGAREASRASFLQAADAARRAGAGPLLARSALGYSGIGVTVFAVEATAVGLLEEALEAVGREGPAALRARILARLAVERYYDPDSGQREALSADAVRLARSSGDAAALADALNARHVALWTPAHLVERLAIADELIALARRSGEAERELQGRNWRFVDLMEGGDLIAAQAELALHEELAARARLPAYLWFGPAWRAMLALLQGRFADAERLGEEARRVGEGAGEPNAAFFHWVQRTALEFERGEPVLRDSDLELIDDRIRRSPASAAWRAGTIRFMAASGDSDRARAELATLAAEGFPLREDMNLLASLAELAMGLEQLAEVAHARPIYRRLLPYAARVVANGRMPDCYGSAELFLGLLAAQDGRSGDAEGHYERGLLANRRLGARPWVARTARHYAEMLLDRGEPGDVERAVGLLGEAGDLARRVGQRGLAREVAALRRRAGRT